MDLQRASHALEFTAQIVFVQVALLNLLCHLALALSGFLRILELQAGAGSLGNAWPVRVLSES